MYATPRNTTYDISVIGELRKVFDAPLLKQRWFYFVDTVQGGIGIAVANQNPSVEKSQTIQAAAWFRCADSTLPNQDVKRQFAKINAFLAKKKLSFTADGSPDHETAEWKEFAAVATAGVRSLNLLHKMDQQSWNSALHAVARMSFVAQ